MVSTSVASIYHHIMICIVLIHCHHTDHSLGITRLNVYSGLTSLYFVRDEYDTGDKYNTLDLPYHPYEAAFAIQDRMFKKDGTLFYPANIGDRGYDDFIVGELGDSLDNLFPDKFPDGGVSFKNDQRLLF